MMDISHSLLILLVGLLCSSVSSELSNEATTTIEGRLMYPFLNQSTNDFVPFNVTTKITLNHGVDYMTYSRPDGSFTIRHVPPGVHVIDVHSVTHHFPQAKCQFKPDNAQENKPVLSCLEYAYPGAPKQPSELPLQLVAIATYDYFEVRKGFSMFGILKNPMFIMMAFSALMMFLMPKMMEGMDDEEKAKMKQQMEMQKDPTKMLGQLWGDITGTGENESSKSKKTK